MSIIDLIEKNKTAAGGWTKEFLRSIGVKWPPPKGWLKRIKEQHANKELQLVEALVSDDYNNDQFVYGFPDDYNNCLEISHNNIMRLFGTIHDYDVMNDELSVYLGLSKYLTEDGVETQVRDYVDWLRGYGEDEIQFATRIWGTKFYFICKWLDLTRRKIHDTTTVILKFRIINGDVMIAKSGIKADICINEMLSRSFLCWEKVKEMHGNK